MIDYVELGPAPVNEDCQQVGNNYNKTLAKEECARYMNLLNTLFPKSERPSEENIFMLKSFTHDFGKYYEVVLLYDDENEESEKYAYDVQDDMPLTWENKKLN